MGVELVDSCARPGGARFGVQDHRSLGGGRWRVDMTAFARFSMASRSMRDAINLAGSQGCSARLRKLDNTTQRLGWTSTSRPTLLHIAALFLLPCIYFCLSVSSPATCESCAIDLGPPAKPRLSPVPPVHARMRPCSPGRLPNPRQTSGLEPVSAVITNQIYVHTLRILKPA